MLTLNFKQLAELFNQSLPEGEVRGVFHDTRSPLPGGLYVAIRGENFDGHTFCDAAKKAGASVLLVDHAVATDLPQIIVEDTILALGQLAQAWRQECKVKTVAITGSAGKTSVKNMVASILKQAFGDDKVLCTMGNFNNAIGLPLSLCQLSQQHDYLVLEMGMNSFGEIDYLSRMVQPDVACINNILPCHTEGVGGVEGVAKAKTEIFNGLKPDGIAILNRDNAFYAVCAEASKPFKQISFAITHEANIMAKALRLSAQSSDFILLVNGEKQEIHLPFPGEQYAMNALAASGCAMALGANLNAVAAGLAAAQLEKHRMVFLRGLNDVLIIDDCYNANPEAVKASINVLMQQPGKHIAVLGDMGEIGHLEKPVHFELGKAIKSLGVDALYCTGHLMQEAANGFGESAKHFDNKASLIEALKSIVDHNTVLLIKASRSQQFETIVDALCPLLTSKRL